MFKSYLHQASRTLALLALICGLLNIQPTSFAGDQVPFRARYNLELVADIVGPIATVTSHGTALASHLGATTTKSISETVNLATGEGVAVHQFTAANGDTLTLGFHLVALPIEGGFDVAGRWEIIEGTGRFVGATGKGTYTGIVLFTSPNTANGSFELTGKISSPGSLKR